MYISTILSRKNARNITLRTGYSNKLLPNLNTLLYTSLEQVSFLITLIPHSSSLISPFDSQPLMYKLY